MRRQSSTRWWRHKTSFDALVKEMVEADRIAIQNEQARRKPRRLSVQYGGKSIMAATHVVARWTCGDLCGIPQRQLAGTMKRIGVFRFRTMRLHFN